MNDQPGSNSDQPDPDELRRIWEEMMKQGFDPEALAAAGGFDGSAESLQRLFENIKDAFLIPSPPADGSGVNWQASSSRAKDLARVGAISIDDA